VPEVEVHNKKSAFNSSLLHCSSNRHDTSLHLILVPSSGYFVAQVMHHRNPSLFLAQTVQILAVIGVHFVFPPPDMCCRHLQQLFFTLEREQFPPFQSLGVVWSRSGEKDGKSEWRWCCRVFFCLLDDVRRGERGSLRKCENTIEWAFFGDVGVKLFQRSRSARGVKVEICIVCVARWVKCFDLCGGDVELSTRCG
jgi:hypothetical protein